MLTTRYNRVRSLSIVLQDIDVVSSRSELDKEQRIDLQRITSSCRSILIDLEDSVDKYDGLGSSHGDVSKKWERVMKRNKRERRVWDLQDRITRNIELLDAYLRQISNKDSVKSKSIDSLMPLWWAARHNSDANIFQPLLDEGSVVESKDKNDQTSLCWAAETNNVDKVQLLLDAGANIESKSKTDRTPLWWAVRNGNMEMIKLLLDRGADVGSQNNVKTPLWWAAGSRNKEIFNLLLNAGANVKSKDNNDQTPTAGPDALHEAVRRFDVQAVEDLLTRAFNDVARDDWNWLHELVEIGYGYQDIAKLLVDEKKSPWIFIEPFERSNSGIVRVEA